MKLAEALGLDGTPSYVVGADVVVGAVGLKTLKEKVNSARCGKATCSSPCRVRFRAAARFDEGSGSACLEAQKQRKLGPARHLPAP